MSEHAFAWLFSSFVFVSLLGPIGSAHAGHQEGVINTSWEGVAIKGYDTVAYFTMGEAVRGTEEFSYEWLEATWHFVNAEHRDLFSANPLAYVPQYGGYCSDAVYVDNKQDINPTTWRIVNGRLYIFYSEEGAAAWAEDEWAIKQADAQWERVKAGLSQ